MSWTASWSGPGRRPELREQPLAQLPERQVRRVDDDVGLGPDRVEDPSLVGDRCRDAAAVAQRMAVARLAVAPDEDVVARLEEDDPGDDPAALERAAHRGDRHRRVAAPDVDDDGDAGEPFPLDGDQLGQLDQQLARHVVDDRVAQVLEELRGRGLAATRQAAEEDDRLFGDVIRDLGRGGLAHRGRVVTGHDPVICRSA